MFQLTLMKRLRSKALKSHTFKNTFRGVSSLTQRQIDLENSNISRRLKTSDTLVPRHMGINDADQKEMLEAIGCSSMEDMLIQAIPESILTTKLGDMFNHSKAHIKHIRSESLYLKDLKEIASQNKIMMSLQGQGFNPCLVPNVILRNVLENPNWYTPYTPYQAEIAQGRLESLLNFQTMVTDLTGMDISNASLLDEATAGAEAMFLAYSHFNKKRNKFFVSQKTFKHVLDVIQTRAEPLEIKVVVGNPNEIDFSEQEGYFGVLVQNPDINGNIFDWQSKAEEVHKKDAFFIIGSDILSLPLTKTPGEMGADI